MKTIEELLDNLDTTVEDWAEASRELGECEGYYEYECEMKARKAYESSLLALRERVKEDKYFLRNIYE